MILSPDAENRRIVSLFVGTKHRNVTDGRTDRQIDRIPLAITAVCIGRAVKTNSTQQFFQTFKIFHPVDNIRIELLI